MHNPFAELMLMHLRDFYRTPEALFWTFIFPIILSGLIGLGFSSDEVTPIRLALVQTDTINQATNLRKLQIALAKEPTKQISVKSYEEGLEKLRKGEANIIISSQVGTFGQVDSLIFHFDPKNQEAQQTYLQVTNLLFGSQIESKPYRTAIISTKGSRYIDFLIPGLLAMGLMNSALWGMGWSLIEFRIKKLMRRIIATPLPRWVFLFSHFVMRYLFAFLETSILMLFAYFAFGVEINGSFAAFLLLASAGLWAFSGIAVLLSSRTSSTTVGNGLINAISLPMTLASGVFFSYKGFPDWLVAVIEKMPLTLLIDGFREVYHEGGNLQTILYRVIVLFVIGTCFAALGLRVYKWY
jgi:ABC-2 type transport system permease protein